MSDILPKIKGNFVTWRPLVPLAIVYVLGAIFNGGGAFFAWTTHRALFGEIAVHGILACGMTAVIVSGGIDLAVGSVVGASAVGVALLTIPLGYPAVIAIPLVLACGAIFGAMSGLAIARLSVQPFVVTLAGMVFCRGLAKLLSGGRKIAAIGGDVPTWFRAMDSRVLGGNVAVVTLVLVATILVTYVLLHHLRVGRYVFAVGGNLEAARLSGVPVIATHVVAYAWCGLCASLAGLCQAARETHGDPETGTGYELDAIAMVVLGGTSLAGGRGHVGLTVIGILTMGTLQKVLSLNAFHTDARLMLTGAVLMFAVLFQRKVPGAR